MTETARDIWERRLAHLQLEEAKAADAEQKFAIGERIREAKTKLAELDIPTEPDAPRIDLTHLPKGADHFLGRGPELAWLDEAWGDSANTHIVELTAPGGVGKTALVKRWLDRLRGDGWRRAARIYAWSFYSQGTGDDRQASEDGF
ncbi:MAG: ATP-binding protein, partial [Gammaproteobacteria bacterium]|nr:ATP-binding protein [Gammaproteobacteria bacterium]